MFNVPKISWTVSRPASSYTATPASSSSSSSGLGLSASAPLGATSKAFRPTALHLSLGLMPVFPTDVRGEGEA